MINRSKLYLFFIGFLLFSCYGSYLTLNKEDNTENEMKPISVVANSSPMKAENEILIILKPIDDTVDLPNVSVPVEEDYEFEMQPGTPFALESWTHDCNWMGVAGQVFYDDKPVENIIVETGGILNGEEVLGLSITGLFSEYGNGCYEIQLSDYPVESTNTVWIQLKNTLGLPLSKQYFLSSQNQCSLNLILANFVKSEQSTIIKLYYPIILK